MITNDDGINAGGIARLARATQKYGEVWVVAPDVQKSGASQGINLHTPILVKDADFSVSGIKAFAVSGSPADCARIGILSILPEKPDLVLSGINFGYNAGYDVHYSGTVGAAMEAVFQGVPAIAVSEGTNDGYIITDMYLEKVLDELIDKKVADDEILNVNFPTCRPDELKGILYGRTVSRSCIYKDHYNCTQISEGVRSFMIEGEYQEFAEEGSDLHALFNKYISVGTFK